MKNKKKNPLGHWWKRMGEKTHGDNKKYNTPVERRKNVVRMVSKVEHE